MAWDNLPLDSVFKFWFKMSSKHQEELIANYRALNWTAEINHFSLQYHFKRSRAE